MEKYVKRQEKEEIGEGKSLAEEKEGRRGKRKDTPWRPEVSRTQHQHPSPPHTSTTTSSTTASTMSSAASTRRLYSYLGRWLGVAGYMVQYGCIAHCTLEFVGDFVVCRGPSMEPTIFSEDVILTEHITPRLHRISRGDVIIARSPANPHHHICKRVIGLEGDRVKDGFKTHYVPKGHVWLEGDNQRNSTDSRNFGSVPAGLIRGRAVFRVWPLSELGKLHSSHSTHSAHSVGSSGPSSSSSPSSMSSSSSSSQ